MKRGTHNFSRIIGFTSIFLITVLLFSCSKMTFVESHKESVGIGSLSIRVSMGKGSTFANNESLRTIAPTQLTETELQNYTLTLTASNYRQGERTHNITLTNGKATLPSIPYGTWQLKLVAYNGNTPVLEGVSAVTVDYIDPVDVDFILTPVETGTGDVNVNFNINATDIANLGNTARVEVGLYDPISGRPVDTAFVKTPTLAQTINYTQAGVPVGDYILRLTIKMGQNNNNFTQDAFVTYSDRIYVESTRTSSATISLHQMFNKPATPATNLSFTYNGNDAATGAANVTLTWGHVFNTNSYELEMLEYTGTAPTNDASWNTAAADAGAKTVQYNAIPENEHNYTNYTNKFASQYYRDGGLLAGQTTIRLGLQIGLKSYVARIRATNYYGKSAWVYMSPTPAIPTIAAPTAPGNFNFTTGYYNSTTQSFTANFTWDDADNEDGYKMEIMRKGNGPTPRNDNDWNALATGNNVVTYSGNNVSSSGGDPCAYEGGSLLADSTGLRLAIKRHAGAEYYAVRLCSYNSKGQSGWVYPPGQNGTTPGTLLMPRPHYTPVATNKRATTNPDTPYVYDATLTVTDILTSTCTYMYEWIALKSMDLTLLFTAQNQEARDAAWKTLRDTPGNHAHPFLSGDNRESTGTTIFVPSLNADTPFPFRVRIVTKSNGQVVDATPWYYHLKTIINPN